MKYLKTKKKERWTNVQGTLFRTYGEFNNKRGFILANSPITLIIERQPNPLPFVHILSLPKNKLDIFFYKNKDAYICISILK